MKKTTLRIFSTVLALLMLLLSLSACGDTVSKEPDVAILNAIDTTQKLVYSGENAAFSEKLQEGFTLEMGLNLSDLLSSALTATMGGIGISLSSKVELKTKGIVDMTKPGFFGSADLMLNDASFININGYLTNKEGVVESEALLGKNTLGIAFVNLAEFLKNLGIIGGDVEIPENVNTVEAYNAFLNIIRFLAQSSEKLNGIYEKYQKLFIETLFDICEATRTTETVTIGDESIEAVVFTTEISDKQILQVVSKIYEAYKADEETRKLVEDIVIASGMSDEEVAEFLQNVYTDLENEFAKIETTGETATVRIEIAAKRGNILRCSAKTKDDTFTVTFGVDPVLPKYAGFESNHSSCIIRINQDKTTRSGSIVVTEDGQTAADISLTWDLETGNYTGTGTIEDTTAIVKGIAKIDKDSYTFTVDEVTVKDITVKVGFTLKLTAGKGTIPELPEYKDISKMGEMDVAMLQMALETNVETLMKALPSDLQFLLSGILG